MTKFIPPMEFKSADGGDPEAIVTKALGELAKAVDEKIGDVKSIVDRIEALEAKAARPAIAPKAGDESTEKKAFVAYLRSGRDAMPVDEAKALRVSDNAAGGFLAPSEFSREIVKNIVQFSPIRQFARVQAISAPEIHIPTRTGTMTAAWVGEVADRSETAPTYGQISFTPYEAACFVDVSNALLEDSAVDIASDLALDGAEEFGRLEGAAFVNGDGLGKPKGILTDNTVTGLASGTAATLGSAPENTLVAMFYKLPAFYRANAAWAMNSNTMQAIRLLKDSTGRFLWQEGLAAGQPGTLLGRPVIELPDMDDVGANKFPIVFGDMGQAYRIIDRVNLSVLRDPYTRATNGITRFHMRRRVGGGVVKGEAIVRLKCATAL